MKPLKNWSDYYIRKSVEEERHIKYIKQLNKLLEALQKNCLHDKNEWNDPENGKLISYCKKCQKIFEISTESKMF